MTKQTQRKRILQSGLTMVILGAVLGVTGLVVAPAGAAGNDHQLTICHATGQGGYTTPNPAKWQIVAPEGHHIHSDDIIPPFAAGSKGSHSWDAYPGKNWTTGNQAIYNAGCNSVPPAAGSITLDKLTAGDGMPAENTSFGFTVSCDTETGTVTAAPSTSPVAPALTVASGLSQGDSCTITETSQAGAASVSHTVGGGSEQSGAVAQVSIVNAEQSVAVVFTNTYRCPEGTTPDGTGGCDTDCVPTPANNQCVPCPVGTPDGQGNCPVPCEPTPANNQCVPCPPGTNPDGQGNCPVPVVVTDACPTVDGIQADVSECPVTVQDNTVTPTPTPAAQPATEVAGVQVAQLPRTGSTTVPLAQLGFGLVLMGVGALLFGREQTITV